MRSQLLGLLSVLALGLTACGQVQPGAGSSALESSAPELTTPMETSSPPELLCNGVDIDPAALEAAVPGSELGADVLASLQRLGDFGDAASWIVLEDSAAELVLIRPQALDSGGGGMYTHELLVLSAAGPGGSGSRQVSTWTNCDLGIDIGGLGTAAVALDPSEPPDAGTTSVALLVTESACASGEKATGRIEVVEMSETDTEIRVVIGVRPVVGAADCQGNPPTPFTLELDRPLGGRTLVNASVHPPRPIVVDD